ncbi:uncharacterized protein LOC120013574 [Tripterygium wilfordii]|uniref:uncharacterized protein LOC120013574 n=1 Tax=Tripterygium wilfordii TaxID=458696 RepID=UPI0018F82985|nr:uncharacterized protein LOC120013574 [Tripterygium wilfordii]
MEKYMALVTILQSLNDTLRDPAKILQSLLTHYLFLSFTSFLPVMQLKWKTNEKAVGNNLHEEKCRGIGSDGEVFHVLERIRCSFGAESTAQTLCHDGICYGEFSTQLHKN